MTTDCPLYHLKICLTFSCRVAILALTPKCLYVRRKERMNEKTSKTSHEDMSGFWTQDPHFVTMCPEMQATEVVLENHSNYDLGVPCLTSSCMSISGDMKFKDKEEFCCVVLKQYYEIWWERKIFYLKFTFFSLYIYTLVVTVF